VAVRLEKEKPIMKCYQTKSSDENGNLRPIEELTVMNLLEELRDGHLQGCDAFGLAVGRDICERVGLTFPVVILATLDPDLLKFRS
jgi:hypothetical protein